MTGTFLLLVQACLYFIVMAAVFHARRSFGIGIFICALGVMHFLETYLAAVFFIPLPFGLISPGSTILFTGKLMMFLLLYMREDAETVRQPIYGLLIGNCLMVAMGLVLRLYGAVATMPGYKPDLYFLDQMGALMVWGTALLFIDCIAIILIYEKLGERISNTITGRIFISSALVLTFDQIMFFAGLHYLTGVPISALYGGWIAKIGAALAYSLMMGLYLRFFEDRAVSAPSQPLVKIFDKLTFRHRYEELLRQSGLDGLTGVNDRGRFEATAQTLIAEALAKGKPVSVLMIDIDKFKTINDLQGHQAGDNVLKSVATVLRTPIAPGDSLFRYGGEEFVIICAGRSLDEATILAERLRNAVEADVKTGSGSPVTVSIGVSSGANGAVSASTLVSEADARLYQAKRAGRNRVIATV